MNTAHTLSTANTCHDHDLPATADTMMEEETMTEEQPVAEPEVSCRNCGRAGFCTRREILSLRVAGYTFRAALTVLHCVSCGQSQWSPNMASHFRLQIASWLARKGVQSGHAFKFMRKSLGLKAVELSRLLSLAPETVSRWERGHRPCDTKALTILGTMVMDRVSGHDTTMNRLHALQSPPPEPTPIDLTELLRTPLMHLG